MLAFEAYQGREMSRSEQHLGRETVEAARQTYLESRAERLEDSESPSWGSPMRRATGFIDMRR